MNDKYLPIGSIVMLVGGEKPLMIDGFCVNPSEDENVKNIFDYSAGFYPEGLLTLDNTIVFNHEDIDKVLFKGYETEDHKSFVNILEKTLKEMAKSDDSEVEKLEL